MQKPLLSIGMIFKDEIRCLERCMKSLAPLREAIPCELVMADTGSGDGSREIAERYADILFDFPWVDDFAAARNAVLERCTGEWHLQLDCDEWLDGDISDLTAFLRQSGKNAAGVDGCLLTVRNYNTEDFREYGDLTIMRLIRMAPGRRFAGRIHEHWNFPCRSFRELSRPILHHDGYMFVSEAMEKAKTERNMALLQKELQERPEDLKLLLQCMDSSLGEDRRVFSKRAIGEVLKKKGAWEAYGPAIFRTAAVSAQALGWPEAETWAAQARSLFPRSLYIQVDVSYYQTIHAMETLDFLKVVQTGEEYLEALGRYHRGEIRVAELSSSHLMCLSPLREVRVRINVAKARCLLQQYAESAAALDAADFAQLDVEAFNVAANTLLMLYVNSDMDVSGFARRLREEARSVPEEIRRAVLRNIALRTTSDPAELEGLLRDVEDWGEVPITALIHALEGGVAFPLPGKCMTLEDMDALAVRLSENKEAVCRLALMAETETLQEICWARALVLAAVRSFGWESVSSDVGQGLSLAQRFAAVEKVFLPLYYAPEMLCCENAVLLPPMHRFGWYCARAFEALDAGDTLQYVQMLRRGLEECSGMKAMVEFLTDHTPQLQIPRPSGELLALAEQVRTILSAYPPDDPAVTALKQSPAYQKVAHLIEGPELGLYGGIVQ